MKKISVSLFTKIALPFLAAAFVFAGAGCSSVAEPVDTIDAGMTTTAGAVVEQAQKILGETKISAKEKKEHPTQKEKTAEPAADVALDNEEAAVEPEATPLPSEQSVPVVSDNNALPFDFGCTDEVPMFDVNPEPDSAKKLDNFPNDGFSSEVPMD